jgi:hypothetical protein
LVADEGLVGEIKKSLKTQEIRRFFAFFGANSGIFSREVEFCIAACYNRRLSEFHQTANTAN